MDPLYPNPGGTVDPADFVGRHAELQRLLEALSHGGAHVTGERRMGKTSLLAKAEAELHSSCVVLRISAETSSIATFEDRLMRELREHRLLRRELTRWEKDLEGTISLGVGSAGIRLHGRARNSPEQTKELDLLDLLASVGDRVGAVLIIDEITVLCQELGPAVALEFLRNLRAQRQGRRPVALVLSGSIGLHHALTDTQAINDLWVVQVEQLTEVDGRELIERLLLGVDMDRDERLISDILRETSGIPYYIQAVVDWLRSHPRTSVRDLVENAIAHNDWHTEHYVARLTEYYGTQAPLARAVLDEFASAFPKILRLDDLVRLLSVTATPAPDRDPLIDLLGRLEKDHYLTRVGGADRMSSALLARIWRIHRRL